MKICLDTINNKLTVSLLLFLICLIGCNGEAQRVVPLGSEPLVDCQTGECNLIYFTRDVTGLDSISQIDNIQGQGFSRYAPDAPVAFSSPLGAAVNQQTGRIFITNNTTQQLTIIEDITGTGRQDLTTFGTAPIDNPFGVAVNNAGNIFMTESAGNRIDHWDSNLAEIGQLQLLPAGLQEPTGIAIGPDRRIYFIALDSTALVRRVYRIERITDTPEPSGFTVGSITEFSFGLTLDKDGRIFVSRTLTNLPLTNRIERYDSFTATTPSAFVDNVGGAAVLQPQGIVADSLGRIYPTLTPDNR